ncbi:Gastrula zinc finger protein xLCGF3.1 [Cladobotryum mycophilum]|uniref:Gastrula zinc finger protein xLCGF3.1 n=1 Tax=Cladobotryum mycophilum TaxID=491253 RepID=A0ABR0SQ37_9HYPO
MPTEIFQAALETFKSRLSDKQNDQFKIATLASVRKQIAQMQRERESHKTTLNFRRFQSFLLACEEFDTVCRSLDLGIPHLSGYIWGPCNWMLFTIKQDAKALECILEWYFKLGQQLPLVVQYTPLIRERPQMRICLAYMYQDLLEFHAVVLRMIGMNVWKKVFVTNWNNHTQSFHSRLRAFESHKKLLDKLLENYQHQHGQDDRRRFNDFILKYQSDRDALRLETEGQDKERKRVQKRDAINWLTSDPGNPEPEIQDHNKFKYLWKQHDTIGRWILKEKKIEEWMINEIPSHSMLWMWKTILTSIIIDYLRGLGFNTSYYYCQESDKRLNENRFLAICKHLLRQMTGYSDDLLPTMEEMQRGRSGSLNDDEVAKTLIEYFCGTNMKQFIVIDGLDELISDDYRNGACDGDRKKLVKFLQATIDKVDEVQPGKVRLLLVSTDLTDMRKLVETEDNVDVYELRLGSTTRDIRQYVTSKLSDLRSDEEIEPDLNEAERIICQNAQGVFLYAVLVIANILRRRDTRTIRYDKTIQGLYEDQDPEDWEFAKDIFSWLACAKRPLKMRELLAINSIVMERDGKTVINYTSGLSKKIKDACGPLVHVVKGNRVEFIHQTASHYILQSRYMDRKAVECDLMLRCLSYLSHPYFRLESSLEARNIALKKKYYAFQDYAVSMWSIHMKSMIETSADLFNDPRHGPSYRTKAINALQLFFQAYGDELTMPRTEPPQEGIEEYTREANMHCESFQQEGFYWILVQVWAHVIKHEKQQDTKARSKVSIKRLGQVLEKNREAIQQLAQGSIQGERPDNFTEYYGERVYKCSLVTCDFFYEGFSNEDALKQHINQHERPFTCPITDCSNGPYGFTNKKDRDKHVRNYHPGASGEPESFPQRHRAPSNNAKFRCTHCESKFTRKVALTAHQNAEHLGQRPFACTMCEKAFVRRHDCRRHEKTVHARNLRRRQRQQ